MEGPKSKKFPLKACYFDFFFFQKGPFRLELLVYVSDLFL